MSDAVASHDPHAAALGTSLFDKVELQQFDEDDKTAGRNICKMLSALFIYTLLAMSVAAGWTYFATHRDVAETGPSYPASQSNHP